MKLLLSLIATLGLTTGFADGLMSDPVRVFTRPDATFFWRTATNATFTVLWVYPEGASSVDLSVRGMNYARSYPGLTGDSFDLSVPEPENPRTEDVYWLTLGFDNGVTRVAQVGVVRGAGEAEAATRCLVDVTSRAWGKVRGSAVVAVPQGASLLIDGNEVDTGLDGAAGWYGLKTDASGLYTLTLDAQEGTQSRELLISPICGMVLFFK